MRTVSFLPKTLNTLHIETHGCIINVRAPMADLDGNPVTSIEILTDDYAGEKAWQIPDLGNARALNVRVVQGDVDASVETPESDDLLLDAITLLNNVQREMAYCVMSHEEYATRVDELREMKRRLGRAYNQQRAEMR